MLRSAAVKTAKTSNGAIAEVLHVVIPVKSF